MHNWRAKLKIGKQNIEYRHKLDEYSKACKSNTAMVEINALKDEATELRKFIAMTNIENADLKSKDAQALLKNARLNVDYERLELQHKKYMEDAKKEMPRLNAEIHKYRDKYNANIVKNEMKKILVKN